MAAIRANIISCISGQELQFVMIFIKYLADLNIKFVSAWLTFLFQTNFYARRQFQCSCFALHKILKQVVELKQV